ncbi:MAG TPA: hypothetical protein VGH47_13570 [Xanthobacteraceae bacterium]|jgi:hypothetical protein
MAEQNLDDAHVRAIAQEMPPKMCGADAVPSPACKPLSTDSATVNGALTVNDALTVKTHLLF